MDLETARRKALDGKYTSPTLEDLKADMTLMVENCIRFNGDGSPFAAIAKSFLPFAIHEIEEFEKSLRKETNEVAELPQIERAPYQPELTVPAPLRKLLARDYVRRDLSRLRLSRAVSAAAVMAKYLEKKQSPGESLPVADELFFDLATSLCIEFNKNFSKVLLYPSELADAVEYEGRTAARDGAAPIWSEVVHAQYLVRFLVHVPQLWCSAALYTHNPGVPLAEAPVSTVVERMVRGVVLFVEDIMAFLGENAALFDDD
jgi:hypothetical protein